MCNKISNSKKDIFYIYILKKKYQKDVDHSGNPEINHIHIFGYM